MFKNLEFENSMKIKNLKLKINQKGFTLIELLVVIAIIGILASFAIASFTSAQAKGRDSRRKSDLDAIKKALELAKGDSTGSAYYPGCSGTEPCFASTSFVPSLVSSYIRAVPLDPSNTGASQYKYDTTPTATTSNTATGYTLMACLENNGEPVGGNVTSSASFSGITCGGTKIYVLNEP